MPYHVMKFYITTSLVIMVSLICMCVDNNYAMNNLATMPHC